MNQVYKQFLVRDWKNSDRDEAAKVIHQVLEEYGLPWQPEEADKDVIEVEAHYLERGGEFWVVETKGKIVGTAAYFPVEHGSNGVEIRKMYLLPKARGLGLGKYLLLSLEKAIADRGFTTIYIETASILIEAVKLYEKYGYQPMTEINTARCDLAYFKKLT